jgi:uncharacterized membrane protein
MGKSATHWPALCFYMLLFASICFYLLLTSPPLKATQSFFSIAVVEALGALLAQRPLRTSEMRNSATCKALSILPTKEPSV